MNITVISYSDWFLEDQSTRYLDCAYARSSNKLKMQQDTVASYDSTVEPLKPKTPQYLHACRDAYVCMYSHYHTRLNKG